jgi:hypothetical protein
MSKRDRARAAAKEAWAKRCAYEQASYAWDLAAATGKDEAYDQALWASRYAAAPYWATGEAVVAVFGDEDAYNEAIEAQNSRANVTRDDPHVENEATKEAWAAYHRARREADTGGQA